MNYYKASIIHILVLKKYMIHVTVNIWNVKWRLHSDFGVSHLELYYSDIDRDGHEISRFGGLPRELYFPKGTEGKCNHEGKYNYLGTTHKWYFIRPGQYLLY